MNPFTSAKIKLLAGMNYFNQVPSAACVAIMPFVMPSHTGLEIGVYRGDSSIIFLEACKYMYFIDPCAEYAENPDKNWFTPEEEYLGKLKPYEGRFKFIKGMSADVADQIPMIDFAFIDANHEHAYVTKDIELYWPKIRPGGFLCGHDYGGGHPGVITAVDDFFMPLGLCIEKHQYCWLVRKP